MSEETNVQIEMTSRIEREKEPDEVTKQALKGQLIQKGTSFYLSYVEKNAEMGESTHVIKASQDQALIMRKGAASMRLPLTKGEETSGTYQSPAGPFQMLAKMEGCNFNWNGEKGILSIVYELNLQNQYVGRFTLEFKLKAR